MSYYLLFVLNLEQENSQVFYDSEAFVEKPIVISLPAIEELVSQFLPALNTVAVVEKEDYKKGNKFKQNTVVNNETEALDTNNLIQSNDLRKTTIAIRPVAAEAYICKVRDLDESSLEKLCSGIAAYITANLSNIAADDILKMEFNLVFSGLREIIDLRNYLLKFVKNPNSKSKYNEGYIYIMKI